MTLTVNKLSIDVFQHGTEDKDKIFSGLKHLFPENLQSDVETFFKSDRIEGYYKNEIIKYYAEFHKKKSTQELFIYIITQLLNSTPYYDLFDRISESGELFIRLNKQALIQNNQYKIDSSSDVYKIVIKFLFFNKKIDKITEIYDYLQSLIQE